jgi:hypothetical protein
VAITRQNPPGTNVRLSPDWYSDNCYFSSIFDGGAGVGSSTLGLLNNDDQGRYYKVWVATICIGALNPANPSTGNAVWEVAIAPITGFTDPVAPIRPGGPTGTGLIVDGYNLSSLDPNRALYQVLEDRGSWTWHGLYPLAIVPVNYSFLAEFGWQNANVSLAVWYEIAAAL